MSEQITLAVEERTQTGKCNNRRMRAEGMVPGIFYSSKGENIMVQLPQLALTKVYEKVRKNHIFNLELNGETRPCLIWELINHPYKRMIQHVDFFGVDMEKPVQLAVPVKTEGIAKSQTLGGVAELLRETLTVTCLPGNIPSVLTIDVSGLNFNDSIRVSGMELPEGVTVVGEEDFMVVTVKTPRGSKIEDEGEEEA